MTFSPDYVRLVLGENFEDAKALFLVPLMAVHQAHLVMLVERRILAADAGRAVRDALAGIDLESVRRTVYDGSYEDLFFYVDRLIVAACGAEVAGRLHTARSRNDLDMTMYRMRLRESVLALAHATVELRAGLLDLARRHRETVFSAHTHTQPAQPTTVAHYLLGFVEELERDATRLFAAYATVNRCPLGACAITGTGFPIDRPRTSALLGFAAPTGNTYGSIAAADYLVESTTAAATLLVGLGRFVQDMLFWCTVEVGYLRLPDGFVQTSSIMPQKRNPVALEHARALASKALAEATAIPHAVHNTPFGDIVDTEDDLQPLVASTFRDATRAVALVAATMEVAELDEAGMRRRAGEGWVTITELADTLAREHGVPFTAAHAIAGTLARTARADATDLPDVLARTARDAGREVHLSAGDLARLLSPTHFVEVRKTPGGPSPDVTAEALDEAARHLGEDERRCAAAQEALTTADHARRAAVAAL